MKKNLILPILCLAVEMSAAEPATPPYVRGERAFVQQPTGTIAWLPHVSTRSAAVQAINFKILKSGSAYQVKADHVYFRVNHRADEEPFSSFLGVQVIRILPDQVALTTPLYVYRNGDWYREQRVLPELQKSTRVSPKDFFGAHGEAGTLLALDEMLGVPWHAQLQTVQLDSWKERHFWALSTFLSAPDLSQRFVTPLPANYQVSADCRLLKFESTGANRTRQPLVFGVNVSEAIAFILRIYSPNREDFSQTIYVSL